MHAEFLKKLETKEAREDGQKEAKKAQKVEREKTKRMKEAKKKVNSMYDPSHFVADLHSRSLVVWPVCTASYVAITA